MPFVSHVADLFEHFDIFYQVFKCLNQFIQNFSAIVETHFAGMFKKISGGTSML